MKSKVILRADGNHKIGLGHIYRLLALAYILKVDFDCIFVTDANNPFIVSQIKKVCSACIVLKSRSDIKIPDHVKIGEEMEFDMETVLTGAELVVIDGYLFGPKYQSAVKMTGCRLVCIDDLIKREFNADIIINPAPGIDPEEYLHASAKIYTGLEYVILRPEFYLPVRRRMKQSPDGVYLAFGGADFFHISSAVLEFCLNNFAGAIHLIYSEDYDMSLKQDLLHLQSLGSGRISLYKNIGAEEIAEILDRCSHAIVSASTVSLEVIARGIKPLIGFYARNQERMYEGLINEGLAHGLGNVSGTRNFEKIREYLGKESFLESGFQM